MDELLKKKIYEFYIEEVTTLPKFTVPGIALATTAGVVGGFARGPFGILVATASIGSAVGTAAEEVASSISKSNYKISTSRFNNNLATKSVTHKSSTNFKDALREAINHKEKTLYDYIIMYCEQKHFEKESDLYKKACVNAKTFAKIRNNETPSKLTLLRICLALELSLTQTQEMLNVAGYSLSNNNIIDKIIAFCLNEEVLNIDRIEDYIFEMTGQSYLIPNEI